jgi:hypothetical protein
MSQESADDAAPAEAESEASHDDLHEAVDDESGLMGRVGVEEEVLAELARAEAKMNDPSAGDDPDAAGAQV